MNHVFLLFSLSLIERRLQAPKLPKRHEEPEATCARKLAPPQFYDYFSQPETGNHEKILFSKTHRFGYPQTYPKIILQSSSAKNIIEKSSSPSSFIPPPHRFYSLRFHFPFLPVPSRSFPFLPVPSRSLPFSISLFLFPCSISFLFFLFLVLSNSLCPALFLLSLFTLPLPETDRKSKTMQNPPVVFFQKKSSNNHRKIIPNPHCLDQPPFTVVRKAKSCKTLLLFSKIIERSSKILRKIIPNPHFLDQPPFTVVRKAKSCKTFLFFSKNHWKNIEQSSKSLRTIFE